MCSPQDFQLIIKKKLEFESLLEFMKYIGQRERSLKERTQKIHSKYSIDRKATNGKGFLKNIVISIKTIRNTQNVTNKQPDFINTPVINETVTIQLLVDKD